MTMSASTSSADNAVVPARLSAWRFGSGVQVNMRRGDWRTACYRELAARYYDHCGPRETFPDGRAWFMPLFAKHLKLKLETSSDALRLRILGRREGPAATIELERLRQALTDADLEALEKQTLAEKPAEEKKTASPEKDDALALLGESKGKAESFVYMYLDKSPTDLKQADLLDAVIYIGMGRGGRLWEHLAEADDPNTRETPKVAAIRRLWAAGSGPRIVRVFVGLTDEQAKWVETALIKSGSFKNLANDRKSSTRKPIDARVAPLLLQALARHLSSLRDVPAVVRVSGI